jgi:ABC-2 type transport system ATP-binding protein
MRQRLGLALALLGGPDLLILDEPTNGLDPAGIREMRELLRSLPDRHGVTVFLSSHLLAEVDQLATHLAVIDGGKVVFQGPIESLRARGAPSFLVGVEAPGEAARSLEERGWEVVEVGESWLRIRGEGRSQAQDLARSLLDLGHPLHHLEEVRPSLEALFLGLTESESTEGSPGGEA